MKRVENWEVSENKLQQRHIVSHGLCVLQMAGASTRRIRPMINVFYVNEHGDLSLLLKRLSESNLTLHGGAPAAPFSTLDTCVTAFVNVVPDEKSMIAMTDLCVEITRGLAVEYDGWYTEVDPDNPQEQD